VQARGKREHVDYGQVDASQGNAAEGIEAASVQDQAVPAQDQGSPAQAQKISVFPTSYMQSTFTLDKVREYLPACDPQLRLVSRWFRQALAAVPLVKPLFLRCNAEPVECST
jgi:hypothetical protein